MARTILPRVLLPFAALLLPAVVLTFLTLNEIGRGLDRLDRDAAADAATLAAGRWHEATAWIDAQAQASSFDSAEAARHCAAALATIPGNWRALIARGEHILCDSAMGTPLPDGMLPLEPVPSIVVKTADDGKTILLAGPTGDAGVVALAEAPIASLLSPAAHDLICPNGALIILDRDRHVLARDDCAGAERQTAAETTVPIALDQAGTGLEIAYAARPAWRTEPGIWLPTILCVVASLLTVLPIGLVVANDIRGPLGHFQRFLDRHNRGSSRLTLTRLDSMANEFDQLGASINRMAANISDRTDQLRLAVAAQESSLSEFHERVVGNFRLLARLLHALEPSVTRDSLEHVQLIEEHIDALTTAYEFAHAAPPDGRISPASLAEKIVAAKLGAVTAIDAIRTERGPDETAVDLDKAILIALGLAYLLPKAPLARKSAVQVIIVSHRDELSIDFRGKRIDKVQALREHLTRAHLSRLHATLTPAERGVGFTLRVPL